MRIAWNFAVRLCRGRLLKRFCKKSDGFSALFYLLKALLIVIQYHYLLIRWRTEVSTLKIPYELLTRGRALLHQQCWLWGQDIRGEKGNLLLAYGFQRKRPPAEMNASTQYSLQLDATLIVRLWGFGIAYGTCDEQAYLNRYDFRPRLLLKDADRWEPPASPLDYAPDTILLEAAVRWLAWYERRVVEEHGEAYRQRLLLQWTGHRDIRMSTAEAWSQLADNLTSAREAAFSFSRHRAECCLLPASAKRGIELHERRRLQLLSLGEKQLR
jgi:hypothetical protein